MSVLNQTFFPINLLIVPPSQRWPQTIIHKHVQNESQAIQKSVRTKFKEMKWIKFSPQVYSNDEVVYAEWIVLYKLTEIIKILLSFETKLVVNFKLLVFFSISFHCKRDKIYKHAPIETKICTNFCFVKLKLFFFIRLEEESKSLQSKKTKKSKNWNIYLYE